MGYHCRDDAGPSQAKLVGAGAVLIVGAAAALLKEKQGELSDVGSAAQNAAQGEELHVPAAS